MEVYDKRLLTFVENKWPHSDENFKANPKTLASSGFYFNPVPTSANSDRVTCFLCKAAMSNWKVNDEPLVRHKEEYNECPLVILYFKLGNYKSLAAARRKTFGNNWPLPKTYIAVPAKLATCGFIYYPFNGKPDNVRCQDCGTDFFGWTKEDDPAQIHKNESPNCVFVMEHLSENSGGSANYIDANRSTSSMEPPSATVTRRVASGKPPPLPRVSSIRQQNSTRNSTSSTTSKATTASHSEVVHDKKVTKKRTIEALSEIRSASPVFNDFLSTDYTAPSDASISEFINTNPFLDNLSANEDLNAHKSQLEHLAEVIQCFGKTLLKDVNYSLSAEKNSATSKHDHFSTQVLAKKDAEIARLTKQLRNMQNSHDNTVELKEKINELQNEIKKMKEIHFMLKEEAKTWKMSWQNLKNEHEHLKRESSSMTRNKSVIKLSPEKRRSWYNGELHLFLARTGMKYDEQYTCVSMEGNLDENTPFMTFDDIPWPISPLSTPGSVVTRPMINTFLLDGLDNQAVHDYCSSLSDCFSALNVDKWIGKVIHNDRERTLTRAQDVYDALTVIIEQSKLLF